MKNEYLVTPSEWAAIQRTQAMEILGTPEAATFLANARQLDLCAELIANLRKQVEEQAGQISALEKLALATYRPSTSETRSAL